MSDDQDARDATVAGMESRLRLQAHFQENIAGQGAAAGDAMPAESTLQSYVPPPPGEGWTTL
jgi:hypothetical protein